MASAMQITGSSQTQSKASNLKQSSKQSQMLGKNPFAAHAASSASMLRVNKSRENVLQQALVQASEQEQTRKRNLLSKIQKQLATALDQKKAGRV